MHIRHWLTELRRGSLRIAHRTRRKRRAWQPRVAGSPLSPAISAQVEYLESRVLLAAPNPLQLSSLLPANGGNGTVGFALNGITNEQSGNSVAIVGDVNGDGLDDLLIGAPLADPSGAVDAGVSYLVFGMVEGAQSSLNLAALNGTTGFVFNGLATNDFSGSSVSGAGDVNGDGFADLLIGAWGADPNGALSGQSYIVFGGSTNLAALDTAGGTAADGQINLAALNGTTGFALNGLAAVNESGVSVSGAGDVNGDGFADLLIGAEAASPNGSYSGQTYLVFGGPTNLAALDVAAGGAADGRINLSALNGTTGFMLNGLAASDFSGGAVSGAGDVNGDGFADLLIGAGRADPNGTDSGQSYLVFGGPANLAALDVAGGGAADGRFVLSALNGTTGFILNGLVAGDQAGRAVSGAGDVNGDGFADLLVGALYADPNGSSSGQAYVVFGGQANLNSLDTAGGAAADGRVNLSALNGTTGFVLNGLAAGDFVGVTVSGAGDVNGDGYADVLIGAPTVDSNGSNAGQTYVVFGGQANLAALDVAAGGVADGRFDLSALNGTTGFTINGMSIETQSGNSVNNAGDVNGDGFSDILIGAFAGSQSFVVFGGNFTNSATQVGTPSANTLSGSAAVDVLVGGRGNDTLVGNGGADVLYGGAGDDTLAISSTTFAKIDGGNGSDTLRLDGSNLTLNLTTLADSKLTNIETIDIRGSGANTLTLSLREVLNITQPSNASATANTLTVLCDGNDAVNIGAGWTFTGLQNIGGQYFSILTQGAATLRVSGAAPNPVQLSSLLSSNGGTGTAGFTLDGEAASDLAGWSSVSSAGDVNGDGLDDILIGAIGADPSTGIDAGITYLVFGRIEGTQPSLNLSTLNGTNGYIFPGLAAGDQIGFSASGAGDVNGDGFADLLIGARFASPNGTKSGQTYIVFGGPTNLAALDTANGGAADGRINLSSLNGTNGFALNGLAANDYSGWSVNSAGDVNGDGFDDVLIGAPWADPNSTTSGQSYLVYGGLSNLTALDTAGGSLADGSINLAALNGTTGFVINGVDAFDQVGYSVSSAGDVNNDGFADLLIGGPGVGPFNNVGPGASYLIFGGPASLAALDTAGGQAADGRFTVSALNGTTGYVLSGATNDDRAGTSVSAVGDVNGDGFVDLLIGAPRANPGAPEPGQSYLLFGGPANISALDLIGGAADGRIALSLLGATTGRGYVFKGVNAGDNAGLAVSGAGDVNGDGFADLLIGAWTADPNGSNSGQSYLVFGGSARLSALDRSSDGATDSQISLSGLNGAGGFTLNGLTPSDVAGHAVNSAGDVNGDGFADFLIGGQGDPNGTNSGQTYVLFGGNFTNSATQVGTASPETLTGTAAVDVFVGGRGNDTLVGNGGADVLYGGAGDDVLAVSSTTFASIDGGNGSDTLRLDGSGLALDLTTLVDSRLTNIETIDIRGSGVNSLTLSLREVLNLTQPTAGASVASSNTLTVLRNADDTANLGAGWTYQSTVAIGGINFLVYTQGSATVQVQSDNQSPVVITSNSAPNVAENTTSVITVTATNVDLPAQPIAYSITGGADQARFSITSAGVLTFLAAPNYESAADGNADNVYLVQVTASDGLGNSAVQSLSVFVTPVNDNNPVFTSTATPGVPENTTAVLTVTAPDADMPAQTVTYSITGGADQAKFSITSGGVLKFLNAPNYENPTDANFDNVYLVQVTANDGAGLTTVQNLSVSVTPVNEVPVAVVDGYRVNENLALVVSIPSQVTTQLHMTSDPGDWIGQGNTYDLTPSQGTFTAATTAGHDDLLFTFQGGGANFWFLEFMSGQPNVPLTPGTYLGAVRAANHSPGIPGLDVSGQGRGSNSLTGYFVVQAISVSPAGVLETFSATFEQHSEGAIPALRGSIQFSTLPPVNVGVLSNDSDVEGNSLTAVLVTGPAHGSVNLNPDGTFTYTPVANYHGTDSFTYKANDGSLNSAPTLVSLVVNALPVFTSSATPSVPENSTAVLTVTATDADAPAQTVTYSLTGGADQAKFSITPAGVLTFLSAPNFESPTDVNTDNVYLVQVTANDGSGGTTAQNLSVTVTPVNDNNPVLTSTATPSIAENTTAVLTVTATDADLPAQTLTYSLTGGADQAKFSITTGGVLTFVSAPNYESPTDANTDNIYLVQVTASDGAGGTTVQSLSVTVTPVNDNTPVFTSTAAPSVPENATAVLTVTATDADAPVQTLTYSITGGNDRVKFSITTGGVMTFVSAPNFESPTDANTDNVYVVQVTANDGAGRTAAQTLLVRVTPVNDNNPAFTSIATPSVAENTTDVITVTATDADLPAQTLTYSITGGADQAKFSITTGGVLTFVSAPDFENPTDANTDNIYLVQVTASDGAGGTTIQNLSVSVTPVNNNNPVFTSIATPNVAENTTAVITVTATDADAPAQTVTYSITGGADQAKFSITTGGVLTFLSAPNYEIPTDANTDNVYLVQVAASDGAGGTAVQNLSVTVTPVNDNNPVFTSIATPSVPENTTTVITVTATDADLPAQTLTYSITGGDDQAKFSITSGGVLTFLSAPNYEIPTDANTDNVYLVQVTANDGAGGTAVQNLSVTVTPVNDNNPVFTSIATPSVPENTTTVITVTATDADLPAQTLTYSITGGDDQAKFSITTGGVLTFVSPPDFESPTNANTDNVYLVQVTANDGAGRTTVQNLSVSVQPVNELPVAVADNYAVDEDQVLVISPLSQFVPRLQMTSDPNDYIGQGGTYLLTPTQGTFSASTYPDHNSVGIRYRDFVDPSNFWELVFAAPLGASLTVGTYSGAVFPSQRLPGDPGLYVFGQGRGNYPLTGTFTVQAISFSTDGEVATFSASFEQHLGGETPALRGTVQFSTLPFVPGGVLANDSDVDGDPLTAVLVTGPVHGTVNLSSDGSFTYTPAANYHGTDSFTYKANDGSLNSAPTVVSLVVNSVPDTPTIQNQSMSVAENSPNGTVVGTVAASDGDADQSLAFAIDSSTLPGAFAVNAQTGRITVANGALLDYEQTDTVTLTVVVTDNDNPALSATALVTVTVTDVVEASPFDIRMVSATSNGTTELTVTYEIVGSTAPAFNLGAYSSDDASFGGDTLLRIVAITAPADLTVGTHVKTWTIGSSTGQMPLPGAGATELATDYFLLLVADATDVVAENDAGGINEDNVAVFSGVYHAPAGQVLVQGGSGADVVSVSGAFTVTLNGTSYTYTAADVAGMRVRTHGGDDTVDAAPFTKTLAAWGGEGNDTLTGGTSSDSLNGGAGNDFLAGKAGSDTLIGGADDDTYSFAADTALGTDTLDESGGGIDTLDFSATTTQAIALNLGLATNQTVNANLKLTLGSATTFENVIGGALNDTLTGNSLSNLLTGGAGNDKYVFDADLALGSDTVDESGGGIDTLDFSLTTTQAVVVNLGLATPQIVNPNLTLTLSAGNVLENTNGGGLDDTLTGNSLANILTGNAGNDLITGAAGDDTLVGGAGNDVYLFAADTSLGNDTLNEAGGGIDTLDFSATATQAVAVNLGLATAQIVNANLTLTLVSPTTFENVIGGGGGDTLTGNGSANLLTGNAGNDVLNGSTGNDTLVGGTGNDTLIGGAGNDLYPFSADATLGSDTLDESGGGTDTLDFSATTGIGVTVNLGLATLQIVNANLTLTLGSATTFENAIGGAQNDSLTGNSLGNTLTGGAGNDTLAGDAGNDIYLFNTNTLLGSDTLLETTTGGGDTLDFSQTTSLGLTVDLSNAAVQFVNANLTLTLGNGGVFENVTGGALDDTLTGNALVNTLTGNAGNDTLAGAAGNDSLTGGAGNDTLSGGDGADSYAFDADTPLGSDTLVETTTGGVDTLNFSSTTTKSIVLDLSSPVAQVVNSNLTLTLGNGGVFENVTGGSLDDILTGNALANTLTGNAGNDTLSGAAGNDTLIGGAGNDALAGGTDNDVYSFDADTALGGDTLTEAPGSGVDLVDFSATTTLGVTFDLSSIAAQVVNANLTLTLSAGDAIENVTGGALDDVLTGNALANTLTGNSGNDTLSGAAGNDALIGGAGNDTLIGGTDNDAYVFDADSALGADTLFEGSAPGTGVDLIDFSQTTSLGITIDLGSPAAQIVNNNLTLTLSSGDVFEMVVGTSLADTLRGNALSNVLIGGGGNDTLLGFGGRDLLVGSGSADSLTGGDDDDLLIAGTFAYFNDSTKVLNRPAIDAIMAEWTRNDGNTAADYATRITHLRTGGGLNGGTLLNSLTVLTDGAAVDSLFGQAGLDWFWKFSGDTTGDLNTGGAETVN